MFSMNCSDDGVYVSELWDLCTRRDYRYLTVDPYRLGQREWARPFEETEKELVTPIFHPSSLSSLSSSSASLTMYS